jgi:2-oxoisovalerate dehydrogenase E2 component (dihydrolipoyl transacylase)
MSELKTFALPDVGEGLTEAEILAWRVAPGDVVTVNQALVEVETAKAAVELPSPFAGTVVSLDVSPGDLVPVGTTIITIDVAPATPGGSTPVPGAGVEIQVHREPVLVGYGAAAETVTRRPRTRGVLAPDAPTQVLAAPPRTVLAAAPRPVLAAAPRPVLAAPPVRALAKSRGVDLTEVLPTGPGGVITRADVEAVGRSVTEPATGSLARPLVAERIPVRGVLRTMAEAMVKSAFTAPHVTEWVTVDVTRSMELLARLRAHPDFDGVHVTPLTLVAAALIHAVRRTPRINGRWDEAAGEIVLPDHINLGIAAATPRGLLVPHIQNADRLTLPALARALAELAETARAGKATPEQLSGGTITITNVGVFGVDGGTPIINPGEAVILCAGRIAPRPWVVDGALAVRQVMELSLSFDHRLVDGALGSQALADVAHFLEDPAVEMLLG